MKTFEELGVSEEIRRAIEELGFEQPMPVQEAVIPYLLGNGNDVIALAQTGTGKTAAYGIPVLQKVDPTQKETQALILSPTRELCCRLQTTYPISQNILMDSTLQQFMVEHLSICKVASFVKVHKSLLLLLGVL